MKQVSHSKPLDPGAPREAAVKRPTRIRSAYFLPMPWLGRHLMAFQRLAPSMTNILDLSLHEKRGKHV